MRHRQGSTDRLVFANVLAMSMKRSKSSSGRGSSTDDGGATGASSKRAAAPEKSWDEFVGGKPDQAFQPYSLKLRYAVGDLILHPKFGKGAVLTADDTQIEVIVAEGKKKLAHGRI